MIDKFKKIYGDEIYNTIESETGLVGVRVKLAPKHYCGDGTIEGLWLPCDPYQKRNQNLWHIKWDKGTYGVVDENEIIKL